MIDRAEIKRIMQTIVDDIVQLALSQKEEES